MRKLLMTLLMAGSLLAGGLGSAFAQDASAPAAASVPVAQASAAPAAPAAADAAASAPATPTAPFSVDSSKINSGDTAWMLTSTALVLFMQEGLDAFKSGQVAMQMNWFAFFPGLYKDPNVGGDKIGFFVNPRELKQYTQLGGQGISVVSYSDHKDDALEYIKWFAQPDVQKKWWQLGGYSAAKSVVDAPDFPQSAPFAPAFLKSMSIVKDFWAEPAYAELLLDMGLMIRLMARSRRVRFRRRCCCAGSAPKAARTGCTWPRASSATPCARCSCSSGSAASNCGRRSPRGAPGSTSGLARSSR